MAENGGNHAVPMEVDGAVENGGDHALAVFAANEGGHPPAVAEFAANGAAANGNGQAPAFAMDAANGAVENDGDQDPGVVVDAANGAVENGEAPNPAPGVAAANGGNAALVNAAAAANAAVGNAGDVVLDLSLVLEAHIYQILIRMPAAMVARCRAVCRMWRDLSSTAAFRREHHFHRSRRPIPLFFYRSLPVFFDDHVRVRLHAADIHRRESFPVFRFTHLDPAAPFADPRVFRIEGSCEGVLLLSYADKLYACNPCTRRWARLPWLHRLGEIVGFYARRDGGKLDYRVLYHAGLNNYGGRSYWILSFPPNLVRQIGRPTNVAALDVVLAAGISPSYAMPSITVQGRVHWQPQIDQYNSYLVVFDTVAEQFSWIRPPQVIDDNRWVQVEGEQLFEVNGRLAMIVVAPTVVSVWVLQDYVGQVWANEYQIQLPVARIQAHGGYEITDGYEEASLSAAAVFAVSEGRNVLIQCPHALLHCDANGNVLRRYQLAGNCSILSRHMLQESLLLHAFLPFRATDAHNGEPPFFQAP